MVAAEGVLWISTAALQVAVAVTEEQEAGRDVVRGLEGNRRGSSYDVLDIVYGILFFQK